MRISINLDKPYVPVESLKCPHTLRRTVHINSGAVSTYIPARCPNGVGVNTLEGGDMYFKVHKDGKKVSYVQSYDTIPQTKVKYVSIDHSTKQVYFENSVTDAITIAVEGKKEEKIAIYVVTGKNIIIAEKCNKSEKDARWEHEFPLL